MDRGTSMPDDDGYPTESELERVLNWSYDSPQGLVEYLGEIWKYDGPVIEKKGEGYEVALHTWGWSGNEDIISSLNNSVIPNFWMLWWRKSEVGGHYTFLVPENAWKGEFRKPVSK